MNTVNFQPERFNTVNPYLIVADVSALIAFMEVVFDATVMNKLDRPGGAVMHAEIQVGDSVVMAGEPMADFGLFPGSLFIYVKDCDRVFKKAILYGCGVMMEPTTMQHAGERYGGVKDKSGNIWWIATHVEDLTPDEQKRRIERMKDKWS